ncbi:DUF177 domain-containing protein [Bombella sp. ESL0385]|uniref:DUF177 domain-containing protein n=1 Tax=Bombella sp. ESL0385 TaxID=2676446 RepID=UPI0012D921CC|nr:DUF177 domain-containing protein [Bombella sp. ESL0385]MUG90387.1 DUF177 domain-containing protein [Bombella sp. ESL0385]
MPPKNPAEPSAVVPLERITPEFSRRIPLAKLGRPLEACVEANAEEREALKQRFGLVSLSQLKCEFQLQRGQDGIVLAGGHLHAKAEQACIITGEPVEEVLNEVFQLRFVPEFAMPADDEIDIESLLQEDADDVPYDGRMIDLGEAAAEQLALCLTPYPRRAGAGLESFVDVTPSDDELDAGSGAERKTPFDILKKMQEK